MSLSELYHSLSEFPFVDYQEQGKVESLTINGLEETVLVQSIDQLTTSVGYGGRSTLSLKETLNNLNLQNSYGGDLGQRVFYQFRSALLEEESDCPIWMNVIIPSGTEHKLHHFLVQLCLYYESQAASLNSQSPGEVVSITR